MRRAKKSKKIIKDYLFRLEFFGYGLYVLYYLDMSSMATSIQKQTCIYLVFWFSLLLLWSQLELLHYKLVQKVARQWNTQVIHHPLQAQIMQHMIHKPIHAVDIKIKTQLMIFQKGE